MSKKKLYVICSIVSIFIIAAIVFISMKLRPNLDNSSEVSSNIENSSSKEKGSVAESSSDESSLVESSTIESSEEQILRTEEVIDKIVPEKDLDDEELLKLLPDKYMEYFSYEDKQVTVGDVKKIQNLLLETENPFYFGGSEYNEVPLYTDVYDYVLSDGYTGNVLRLDWDNETAFEFVNPYDNDDAPSVWTRLHGCNKLPDLETVKLEDLSINKNGTGNFSYTLSINHSETYLTFKERFSNYLMTLNNENGPSICSTMYMIYALKIDNIEIVCFDKYFTGQGCIISTDRKTWSYLDINRDKLYELLGECLNVKIFDDKSRLIPDYTVPNYEVTGDYRWSDD